MKVRVDKLACEGHGRCYEIAPGVYDEDERGHCLIRSEDVPPEREATARLAAKSCPEAAITVIED